MTIFQTRHSYDHIEKHGILMTIYKIWHSYDHIRKYGIPMTILENMASL